jgi:enoyl-CoA hydratase/carnithine racemase
VTALRQIVDGSVLLLEFVQDAGGDAGRAGGGLAEQLADAWQRLDEDDLLRVAVLTGPAGGFARIVAPAWDLDVMPLHTGKPVIAAVEGACTGLGFELALACDLRIAGEGSSFGFPDLEDAGPFRVASVLLPRITFAGLSLELLMTAKTLDANAALRARLVNRVVPAGQALPVAIELSETMAGRFGDGSAFKKQRILGMSGVPVVTAMRMAREA